MKQINEMRKQTKNEIRIFKRFMHVCPYSVSLSSIVKNEPPEPDISCKLTEGNTISFELVECIDKTIAQSVYGSLKVKKAFDDELEKLPKEKKKRFRLNFGDALIFVAFNKEVSASKKRISIPMFLDYLLALDYPVQGKINLHSHKDLGNVVRYILISRGVVGPLFDVEKVGFFADPCLERIRDKFETKYEIKSKTELLAYYELQPELREDVWLPLVQEFVENNIGKSVFQRVWIYSVTKDKIIYVYPDF